MNVVAAIAKAALGISYFVWSRQLSHVLGKILGEMESGTAKPIEVELPSDVV
jgi:hypothetical protein